MFPLSPFFWQFGAVRNVPAVSAIKSARLAHRPIPCTFSCQAAFFFGLLLDYWVTPYLILLARLAICRKMSRTRPGQARLPFTPHPSFVMQSYRSEFFHRRLACAYFFLCPGIAYGLFTSRLPALKAQTGADEAQIGLFLLSMGGSSLLALLT